MNKYDKLIVLLHLWALNRGYLADFPLLRTLFAIWQKFWDSIIWEMMDYFLFFLLAYASLATSRTLPELSLRFRIFILFIQRKKSDFYQIRQQQQQLKNM